MCEEDFVEGLGMIFVVIPMVLLIGVPIVSTIAFIYMARFKGKMILASALFIPIFGTIPAIGIWAILIKFSVYVFELFNIETMIKGNVLLSLFILLSSTFALYSVLGYACRKWRIKNNIPSNRVLEKDTLVIIMALLVCNIIFIICMYIYLTLQRYARPMN